MFRFEGFELEPAARELRNNSGPVHVEQQVFDVLRHLVEHRDRVVPKTELLDEVWGDRFVSESALTSRIKSARQAVGDSGDSQQLIRTIRGVGYRFVASVDVVTDKGPTVPPDVERRLGTADGPSGPELRIRFVEAAGGVSLAVAETGEGPCLVKTATWLTQVDKDTDNSPVWGHWVRALSRRYHYVRYDPRGCGLSDRDLAGQDLTNLDLWIDDLRRVIDDLDQERVALLGVSQGGPVAVGFAARYPERVSHLILYGTYARGMKRRGDPIQFDEAGLQVDLRAGWLGDDERQLPRDLCSSVRAGCAIRRDRLVQQPATPNYQQHQRAPARGSVPRARCQRPGPARRNPDNGSACRRRQSGPVRRGTPPSETHPRCPIRHPAQQKSHSPPTRRRLPSVHQRDRTVHLHLICCAVEDWMTSHATVGGNVDDPQ